MASPVSMNVGGMGTGAGYGSGAGMGGAPGTGVAGMASPASMNLGGMGTASGSAVAAGTPGSLATSSGGAGNNATPSGNAAAMQANGQQAGGSVSAAGVARPDGYINGRPNDGNPPPAQPAASNSLAMVPAAPLLPGEYRPSEDPPKRDRDEIEKEEKEKKKHPYDKVKNDHNQEDWALRNSTRHAAAISRPVHVDCYPDRFVLVPDAGGEPRVILCENGGRRDADKFVAAVWEIMDTWGMAGREMYWRPILNFYVVPGAEPRMLDLTRSLEGSGLVIERKQ